MIFFEVFLSKPNLEPQKTKQNSKQNQVRPNTSKFWILAIVLVQFGKNFVLKGGPFKHYSYK